MPEDMQTADGTTAEVVHAESVAEQNANAPVEAPEQPAQPAAPAEQPAEVPQVEQPTPEAAPEPEAAGLPSDVSEQEGRVGDEKGDAGATNMVDQPATAGETHLVEDYGTGLENVSSQEGRAGDTPAMPQERGINESPQTKVVDGAPETK